MILKSFLESSGLNMKDIWIYSIVAFINNNFNIKQKPNYYYILQPHHITQFILNQRKNVNDDILKEATILIEPYCIELSYTEV